MAIKKSELYSSLWASCDELRGGMDASQYKDYVLVMLFIKYISDKYVGVPFAPITVPKGAGFKDMVALKGKPTIGDDINKKILGPIGAENKISDFPDFDDPNKLGTGSEKVNRLTNLIAIFENPALDFSKNKADGDDILGDAYEFLMRHFATESGKSKGQFYTPAEVSRIMAKIIGVNKKISGATTTCFDPTSGSGSLLLKVGDESGKKMTLYGQEMDVATASLARMNMILHNYPTAEIKQGNTLANPRDIDKNTGLLITFDFAVSNPPFSSKAWSTGVSVTNDPYKRFQDFGIPPAKNGDYAFLLHVIRSLKSKGKGAIILPHGVLFRGNAEGGIREKILRKGYIKGVIGLPPNLFYGTGIPACIIVIDKENADNRKAIFMIDASKGFIKDGNKNRLREQDIHKIVDAFNNQIEIPKYSRIVPLTEIEANEFNLNIPRYIDSQEPEDLQDIEAHLLGGIPNHDIDELDKYWDVYPTLKSTLFKSSKRKNYSDLRIAKEEIKKTIFEHSEFTEFSKQMDSVFNKWEKETSAYVKELDKGLHPKQEIQNISESLLKQYTGKKLTDKYAMYQHLMDYWAETMQDDMYEIAADGWIAGKEVKRIEKKSKKGDKEVVKVVAGLEGLEGRLIPPYLLIQEYFIKDQTAIDNLEGQVESLNTQMDEMREEHSGEEGLLINALDDKQKISRKSLQQAIKDLGKLSDDNADEYNMLQSYKKLMDEEPEIQGKIKAARVDLEKKVVVRYAQLTVDEIKGIVVEKKWMLAMEQRIHNEMDNISQRLTQRIKELAERYEKTLTQQTTQVADKEAKVNAHLHKMGFQWK
jgi:type I restriction enzyme M protein